MNKQAEAGQQSIIQMSWVVPDMEEAARRWHAAMGVGPFLLNRHLTITDPLYRGQPGAIDFSVAIAQAGEMQIELVEQHDDKPSCYRDMVPAGQEAMHHVAIMVQDFEAAQQRYLDQGFEVASAGYFGKVRFCYIDCRPMLGHMVEIVQDCTPIRKFFGAVRNAAEEWDGNPATLLREM